MPLTTCYARLNFHLSYLMSHLPRRDTNKGISVWMYLSLITASTSCKRGISNYEIIRTWDRLEYSPPSSSPPGGGGGGLLVSQFSLAGLKSHLFMATTSFIDIIKWQNWVLIKFSSLCPRWLQWGPISKSSKHLNYGPAQYFNHWN